MPDSASPSTLLWIGLIYVLAGLVKGATGMGLPTVAMALLGSLLSPPQAAALLLVPSFITNVWQLCAGPSVRHLVRQLSPMMAGILVGTIAVAPWLASGKSAWTSSALGGVLFLYAAISLFAWQWAVPPRHRGWLSPLIGLATGAVTGATGVFVIPAVPYLQALQLGKDDLVQALGLSFTVSTLALAVGLASQQAVQGSQMTISALATMPALPGKALGQVLRQRVSATMFRRGFLVCLLLLGAELALRPLYK